jgi:heme-degrading monooxygenase HmoA
MIRAMLLLTVRDGEEHNFEVVWARIAETIRDTPGNVSQTLLRATDDPRRFVIVSDWVSREAFTAFERSAAQDALTAPIRKLRQSARMDVHLIQNHVEGNTQP